MIIANWEKETPREGACEMVDAQLKQACGCINYITISSDNDGDDDG